jgi:hypothetical protein
MPEEYSTLRQAVDRIVGAPAGGAATAGTARQASNIELAPRTPYSQELETATPSTSLTIGNTPFDPYAAEAAQLAAMQGQTAALNAQIAGTAAAAAPTAAPAFDWRSYDWSKSLQPIGKTDYSTNPNASRTATNAITGESRYYVGSPTGWQQTSFPNSYTSFNGGPKMTWEQMSPQQKAQAEAGQQKIYEANAKRWIAQHPGEIPY